LLDFFSIVITLFTIVFSKLVLGLYLANVYCILISLVTFLDLTRCFSKCLGSNRCTTCSEPMCHPFENDASHINLWDVWFPNYPAYFGQSQNYDCYILSDDCYILSGVWLLCVFHSWFRQCNPVVLWNINIGSVIGEQHGYAAKITNRRYTSQKPNNTRLSLFLGGFRTYHF
jgi:hypothetical protein